MSLIVTFITTHYHPTTVLMAIAMTVGVSLALTLYVLISDSPDYSIWIAVLLVSVVLFIIAAIAMLFCNA